MADIAATPESLTLDAAAAARLIGVSRSTFLRLDATGGIGPRSIRLGRRRVWLRSEIVGWVEQGRGCSRAEWLIRRGGAA